MGKFCPENTMSQMLDYIALSDFLVACSGSPVTFTSAFVTNMLAKVAISGSYFSKAADSSGCKVTISAVSGVPITNTGFCEAIALVNAAGSSLRYVTTATGQTLTAAGSVDFPGNWKINIQAPS